MAVISVILLAGVAVAAYKWKKKSAWYVRLSTAAAMIVPMMAFAAAYQANVLINNKMGRKSDFINLTIHSYLQLTSFPYAQFILAFVMMIAAGKLLDTQFEYKVAMYMERSVREDKTLGKRTKVSILLILIAVMAAIAVAGRMAFFMIPQFKPVTAIVIITGIGLGAEAGFLTGAIAGFVSNFFFGQGPWTPWQMFAFGIIGFLARLLFRGNRRKYKKNRLVFCLFGGAASLVIYGLLMDTSAVVTFSGNFDWKMLLAAYAAGLPFNIVHGLSTMVFLFFLARPMDMKLERIKKKYGILEV